MEKLCTRLGICLLITLFCWFGTVLADRDRLSEEIIRIHVVANSDSQEDQHIKRYVRDAITESLKDALADMQDPQKAKAYLQENLPKLQQIASEALDRIGWDGEATVTYCREAFACREYDGFSLPAGVYDALRITIGEGKGENWWCVAFPAFCYGSPELFEAEAAAAGFPDSLTNAMKGKGAYVLRFYLLDILGEVENILWME